MAEAIQDDRRIIPEDEQMAGEIAAWLDQPVVVGEGFDDLPEAPKKEKAWRMTTCSKQVIADFYGRQRGTADQRFSVLVGKALAKLPGWKKGGYVRVEDYGQQWVYTRTGAPSDDG